MAMTMRRITGTNNTPLGPRRFGKATKQADTNTTNSTNTINTTNTTDALPATNVALVPLGFVKTEEREGRSHQRKQRWGRETAKDNKILNILGMETALTAPMTTEQVDAYALNLRIKEITQKLYLNDIIPNRRERSPSPPPTYDSVTGRRTNTRETRHRKKLEDERHRLVEKAMRSIPEFKPPSDYRRPIRTEEKIYIPVKDYPEVNFIGQILGFRGETLKGMEKSSGAKIAIRGRGSVKEGKRNVLGNNDLNEDLHCVVTADMDEKVAFAVREIEKIIETAASVPDSENAHKTAQLRYGALINGTLRHDEERMHCEKCGERGHRRYNCTSTERFNANVFCGRCGQGSHHTKDCKAEPTTQQGIGGNTANAHYEKEYQDLMADIGGGRVEYGQFAGRIENINCQPAPWKPAPWASQYSQSTGYHYPSEFLAVPPQPLAQLPPGCTSSYSTPFPPPGMGDGLSYPGNAPHPSMWNGFHCSMTGLSLRLLHPLAGMFHLHLLPRYNWNSYDRVFD
jgi:splicing factor 1